MQKKISSFTSLKAWQEAHRLSLSVYKVLPEFPKYEQFGLSDQIRRSVTSISANISEGFGRKGRKDKIQFYYIANGSLAETQNHLLLARDLGYIKQEQFKELANQTVFISKLINGLIKSIREADKVEGRK